MHIYLRTVIEDEFPEREKRIAVSHVEFFPWYDEVQFFNLEKKDHDTIDMIRDLDSHPTEIIHYYEYEGIRYDFLTVYPFDPE